MTDLEFFNGRVNDENGKHTIGDFMRAVLAIENDDDARRFYRGCVHFHATHGVDAPYTPWSVTKANIGWCYGEGMSEERRTMWIRVCDASHPVFGQSMPSMGEAFEMGRTLGSQRGAR